MLLQTHSQSRSYGRLLVQNPLRGHLHRDFDLKRKFPFPQQLNIKPKYPQFQLTPSKMLRNDESQLANDVYLEPGILHFIQNLNKAQEILNSGSDILSELSSPSSPALKRSSSLNQNSLEKVGTYLV